MKAKTKRPSHTNLWVYKCTKKQRPSTATGDWHELFAKMNTAQRWGGSHSTANSVSIHILNKIMKQDDLVMAYQTDERSIIGTCQVAKLVGEPGERRIWLKPVNLKTFPLLLLVNVLSGGITVGVVFH